MMTYDLKDNKTNRKRIDSVCKSLDQAHAAYMKAQEIITAAFAAACRGNLRNAPSPEEVNKAREDSNRWYKLVEEAARYKVIYNR
jgi:hypothetical protein